MNRRLSINSDLQIFFDDNEKAKFHSVKGAPIEAVKAELIGWQAFVETWLVEVEDEPKPERLNLAQQKLKRQLSPVIKLCRSFKMKGPQIRDGFAQLIAAMPSTDPDLSPAQIQAVLDLLTSEGE